MASSGLLSAIRRIPKPIVRLADKVSFTFPLWVKHTSELSFWQEQWRKDPDAFLNPPHYEELFLAMADEPSADFVRDKVVADFGCGPRNTLGWADQARLRIGIDVLAEHYARFGIARYGSCFVRCSEKAIPLPSNYVDVLFTANAIDHVRKFNTMCGELLRILADGGELIASINLNEPRTVTEPQTLTEERVRRCLLRDLDVVSCRIAPMSPPDGAYRYLQGETDLPPDETGKQVMWVRARKKA